MELEFTGAPEYVEGKAWQIESRPYVRFVKAKEQLQMQRYGMDSPTFASSSASGHSAGMAADGNGATYWSPAADDKQPFLTLDVERTLDVHSVKAVFAASGAGRCVVELSTDESNWQKVAEAASRKDGAWEIRLEKPVKARLIRFSFPQGSGAVCPALAEVEASGTVAY